MISFQKIYGLHGLEHHTMEINGDLTMVTNNNKQQGNIELLSLSTLEAEFRNSITNTNTQRRTLVTFETFDHGDED